MKCIPHVYLSIKMPQGTHTTRLYGTGTTGVDSASVHNCCCGGEVGIGKALFENDAEEDGTVGSDCVPWYCGL